MAKRYYWLKLKEDYFNSPKIKKLRKIAGGDTYTIIYLKMLLLSVKNQGALEFEGIEETFAEELALILNEDAENVSITLAYLSSQGLIESVEDSSFLLPEAAESIGSENESAERVREFRRRKELQCNAPVTQSNVLETACNTDIDREIEIEIDKEIEIEKRTGGKCPERKRSPRPQFVKPTVEEVRAYCQERKNKIDPEKFVDYYEANGWKVGKTPMKDWQAAVRNWERRDQDGYSAGNRPDKNQNGARTLDLSHLGTVV